MITTGIFAIPLVSDLFSGRELDWNRDWTNVLFTTTSALGCIWGLMAHSQFDTTTKMIKNTWHLCRKLDPFIGEYDYKTFNPETNNLEDGYAYHSLVDFWDRENEVPNWLDKGKYWNILLELRKINKNIRLEVTKDANLPFKKGKGNLVVILKKFDHTDSPGKKNGSANSKNVIFRVIIPQWLVINTEYKRFNVFSQAEINTVTSIFSDVNKNIPKIIDEIIFKEEPFLKYSGNILTSLSMYLNKSLPIRIVYGRIIEILPGVKERQIQYTNENLSSVSLDYLIDSILLKARTTGINQESLTKLQVLAQYLKKEYDKLGLGEGSSEYHNLHHSLEVAYMSLNMLPKEIHGYTITKRDYEIMLVAALLHDYDPVQGTSHYDLMYSRVPTVANTVAEIKRKRIHDAYFILNSELLVRFFRKYAPPPLIEVQEFATTHTEMLNGIQPKIEGKIVEALIWRTDYPFDENAYNNLNQLLKEIDGQDFSIEKINLIAEILSLADLSVTYLSSDPLLAWNRVVKLYEELDFPLVGAVSRTDRFLSLFSEGSLFKEIISRKTFPDVFRQKWDNVYQFFHEGNPSNKINNLILDAKTRYEKINMDVSASNCDYLIDTALQNKNEYHIGIVKDKEEIIKTQTRLSELQIENLEILPGNPDNILPFIKDKSVDNFMITIFCDNSKKRNNKERILKNLLHSYMSKLSQDGTIQIIVENEQDFRKIISLIPEHDFKIINTFDKVALEALNPNKYRHNTNDVKNVKIITIQKQQNDNNNIQK
jgi:tRNA G46 methylase TrmB